MFIFLLKEFLTPGAMENSMLRNFGWKMFVCWSILAKVILSQSTKKYYLPKTV